MSKQKTTTPPTLRRYGHWKKVANTSWGADHVDKFGNHPGYIVCRERNRELEAVASVIGVPFVPKSDIDATASLIAHAPDLYRFAVKMAQHEKGCCPSAGYMVELIEAARAVVSLVNDTTVPVLFDTEIHADNE